MRAVLVDTSLWIRLFRGDPEVEELPRILRAGMAHVHPWCLAELELGDGVPRKYVERVERLPRVRCVADDQALAFLRMHRLQRSGIGWIDLHLLAAAHARGCALWTADAALEAAARRIGLSRAP